MKMIVIALHNQNDKQQFFTTVTGHIVNFNYKIKRVKIATIS